MAYSCVTLASFRFMTLRTSWSFLSSTFFRCSRYDLVTASCLSRSNLNSVFNLYCICIMLYYRMPSFWFSALMTSLWSLNIPFVWLRPFLFNEYGFCDLLISSFLSGVLSGWYFNTLSKSFLVLKDTRNLVLTG